MSCIKQHVQPFPWCQKAFGDRFWPLNEATISSDHREIQRHAALHKSQAVDARIGAVEHSQSIGARRDGLNSVGRQVGQHDVTQPAHHGLVRVRLVAKAALRVKPFVLDDQRQVSHPQFQIKRFGEFALVLVFDQEETGQTVVRLLCGQHVRMRVVPIGAAAVAHSEVVVITPTRCRCIDRMTIHVGRHVQAVPVDDGGLLHCVIKARSEAGATLDTQDRVLKGLTSVLGLVQQEG